MTSLKMNRYLKQAANSRERFIHPDVYIHISEDQLEGKKVLKAHSSGIYKIFLSHFLKAYQDFKQLQSLTNTLLEQARSACLPLQLLWLHSC